MAEVWSDTEADMCQSLIENMPRGLEVVIKAKEAIPLRALNSAFSVF